MKKLLTIVAIGLTVLGTSCQKGDKGETGATGNANVNTLSFSIPAAGWSTNPTYSWEIDAVYHANSFNFNGAVLCYASTDNNIWNLLPTTSLGNSPYYELLFTYDQSTSNFALQWSNITPNSVVAPTPPAITYFKIVGVPPAMAKYKVNTKDIYEVDHTYNLHMFTKQ